MRNLALILCFLMVAACNTESRRQEKMLQAQLKKKRAAADFKPLGETEAYDFINRYYLPHLDTLPYKRKIFIHPITGRDFCEVFKRDSLALVKKTKGNNPNVREVITLPPTEFYDTTRKWNGSLLKNVRLIKQNEVIDISIEGDDFTRRLALWRKRFGIGYVSISYPQYNPHTKKLFFREWVEDGGWCGTGREREFLFVRVAGGWRPM
nr:hypothetical protein [uncultured Mucilaginibacter sp.]